MWQRRIIAVNQSQNSGAQACLQPEVEGDDHAVNVSLLENIENLSFSSNNGEAQVQTALLLQLTNEE